MKETVPFIRWFCFQKMSEMPWKSEKAIARILTPAKIQLYKMQL